MCGRFGRKGNKQKIATAFYVKGGLGETDFDEDDDARPGSLQPVIRMDENGDLAFANMRWGFKTPKALLFNTRADTAATSQLFQLSLRPASARRREALPPIPKVQPQISQQGRTSVRP